MRASGGRSTLNLRASLRRTIDHLRPGIPTGAPAPAPAPAPVRAEVELPDEATLRSFVGAEPWCVDDVRLLPGGGLEIRGWAIPPQGAGRRVSFRINEQSFEEVEYPIARPDIERLFWFLPGSGASGFVCRTTRRPFDGSGVARLSYGTLADGSNDHVPLRQEHELFFLDPSADTAPLPPPERRSRVHGGTAESAFRLEGFSTFMKLEAVLRARCDKSYADFSRILDWGSGCGRMTRYFRLRGVDGVTGVDIDADNVEWCSTAYPEHSFAAVPLVPPTDLPAQTFTLLIGISVFTHLREPEQFAWLEELRRISAPGAILLMTVHGKATSCRSGLHPEHFARWLSHGFFDLGSNPDLGSSIPSTEYYRNTLHAESYIHAHWSRYFDVLEIVPGLIGNHQDLVVMQRR